MGKPKALFHRLLAVVVLILLMGSIATASSEFEIAIDPIGHWHVFNAKTLKFTISDSHDAMSASDVNLQVQIARVGSDRITNRSVEADQISYEGDGVYSLEYTPSSIGSYALIARFEYEGSEYASTPVAFEVAKDGDEGVMAVVNETPYVYQIRYFWDPGHIHANDSEMVTLSFELMRGIQEGEDINWEQPWRNNFDHVASAENLQVFLTSEDGAISEEITCLYKGRGIYEAQRLFPEAEVGHGKDYEVRIVFSDPYNGAEVTNSEPYPLHAVASH